MVDFRCKIAEIISDVTNISKEELENFIEKPKNSEMGDYAFPCFKLAKELKKAPVAIAEDLKDKIVIDENIIEKVEIVSGYLNFYINKKTLAKEVLKEFVNATTKFIANPNSTHPLGIEAKKQIDSDSKIISSYFNINPESIIYTSGSSESNNLVIKGIAEYKKDKGKHIIISSIEHSSIVAPCNYLANQGFNYEYILKYYYKDVIISSIN